MLVIARSGAGMGRAVVTPTHNSLLSDYYPIEVRADVFGFHRMANALGAFIGPVVGGVLAEAFGWRVPFFVFVIPSIVFVVLGMRLREPGRGHHERRAAGASEAVIATDEEPPSWAESVRILWQIRTLRRIWFSLPFLAASVIGLASLTSLYYEEVFNLSESQRGLRRRGHRARPGRRHPPRHPARLAPHAARPGTGAAPAVDRGRGHRRRVGRVRARAGARPSPSSPTC